MLYLNKKALHMCVRQLSVMLCILLEIRVRIQIHYFSTQISHCDIRTLQITVTVPHVLVVPHFSHKKLRSQ